MSIKARTYVLGCKDHSNVECICGLRHPEKKFVETRIKQHCAVSTVNNSSHEGVFASKGKWAFQVPAVFRANMCLSGWKVLWPRSKQLQLNLFRLSRRLSAHIDPHRRTVAAQLAAAASSYPSTSPSPFFLCIFVCVLYAFCMHFLCGLLLQAF